MMVFASNWPRILAASLCISCSSRPAPPQTSSVAPPMLGLQSGPTAPESSPAARGDAPAQPRLYRVGAGQPFPDLQSVAEQLLPGDVVEVLGDATYAGGLVLRRPGTRDAKITIRGVRVNGRRPVIQGGKDSIEFAGNHYVFEGFEVTGGSFRCVFHHAHDITLRDTIIHDCPGHGVLGADSDSGSLLIEHSEVFRCGDGERRHQIYAATDQRAYPGAVFRMQHSYVHDALGGNNVKSRAGRSELYYNWIEGAFYHELELIGADGQPERLVREDADVVGNVLFQGHRSRSHFPIRVGGDGTGQSWGRYRFVNNTIILGEASRSAVFRVFHGVASIEMQNNVLYRLGAAPVTVLREVEARWESGRRITGANNWVTTGSLEIPPEWTGTIIGVDPGFADIRARNLAPRSDSPLRDRGVRPALPVEQEPPLHELVPPDRVRRRPAVGALDVGAYEFAPP